MSIRNHIILGARHKSGDIIALFILFFICPFLSFLLACRKPLEKSSQVIIILYFGLIGFYRRLAFLGDAKSWTDRMELFYGKSIEVSLSLIDDSLYNIAYILFIYFLAQIQYTAIIWSIIYMLTIVAFLFIYESQHNDFYIDKNKNLTIDNYVLFLFFLFFIPMTSFGVKFWVAFDVYLLGFYYYIIKGKKLGLIVLTASVFFHYSFAYMLALFFAWYFICKKPIYSVFLIFLLPILLYMSSSLNNSFIESKYESYASGSLIEERAMWLQFDRIFSALFSIIAVLYLIIKRNLIKNSKDKTILSFLAFFALGLIPLLPTLDGLDRFSRLFTFMVLVFLVRLSMERKIKVNGLVLLSIPVFSYHLLANYFMRKGEWDLDIFYNTIYHFLTGDLMTRVV